MLDKPELVDRLRGKLFPESPALLDLFNQSVVPFVLQVLLGPGPVSSRHEMVQQTSCQLALRFPGDLCPGSSPHPPVEDADKHFTQIRQSWHIDGLPTDFIPGVTDHFGTIKNFDVLVGVLLSDVDEKMAGELCVYPSSHYALSEHFHSTGIDEVRKKGNSALPTGKRTDELFFRPPVHCLGKSGDVFLANYLTAHFIAPNCSSNIRHAVYFRVTSPWHPARSEQAMLQPWLHWPGLADIKL